MQVNISALTDKGLVRSENEDAFGYFPDNSVKDVNMLVVCDGMGGHTAGDVAAQTAVTCIKHFFYEFHKLRTRPDALQEQKKQLYHSLFVNLEKIPDQARSLVAAIRLANRQVFRLSRLNPKQAGMGATIVAVTIFDRNICICHVGDSRAYRIRDNHIDLMTKDHSRINELISSGQITTEDAHNYSRNEITRALGYQESIEVDVSIHAVQDGDIYFLCSDGLVSDPLSLKEDEKKKAIILKTMRDSGNLRRTCMELIHYGKHELGGADNITAGLVQCAGIVPPQLSTMLLVLPNTIPWEHEKVSQAENDILSGTDFLLVDMERQWEEQPAVKIPIPRKQSRAMLLILLIILLTLLWLWGFGLI
ncbi:MAG: hypothetical protein B6244_00825 [Candidatus Cloacimonetes bacterium 4572_55]|nr:MAG: hypothetical protein B6244_00825 [Candidatus Cloacimonetes bacterium 4572_55]